MESEAANSAGISGGEYADSGRNETRNEQRDRNWNDLLQELRVMQTGTQIIAGFLLTLPFQQRFSELELPAEILYLALVVLAAVATCMMLVPVATHRKLFGLRIKERLVASGHRIVTLVLWLIGSLLTGTTALIFYMVLGGMAAAIISAVFALGLVIALSIYPGRVRSGKLSHDR